MGIPHWEVKREILRVVFREARSVDVIEKVVDTAEMPIKDYENLVDHYMHRWHLKSFPGVTKNSKYRPFFRDLSLVARLNEHVPGDVIINGGIVQFVQALPEEDLARLQDAVTDGLTIEKKFVDELNGILAQVRTELPVKNALGKSVSGGRQMDSEAFFPIWTAKTVSSLRIVQNGLEAKFIDQSLYYLSTESVYLWFAITNNKFYSGFDQCKTGLMKLVREPEWKNFIESADFESVIMLGGGGSPSKDAILVKSLIEASQTDPGKKTRKRYALVDTSAYMIASSRRELESDLREMGAGDAISLITVETDLMDIGDAMDLLRPRQGNVAWFLTGGTIGNLDEDRFFSSVASHAQPNDMLVVGIGCIDDEPDDQYLSNLKREYEQDEIRRLVKVPLAAAWSALDLPGAAHEALDHIKIDIVNGDKNSLSDVKGSVTVIGTLSVEDIGEIMLFKSSRYREEAFLELAERHRWAHSKSVDGLDNSFRQVIFRYNG